MMGRLDDLERKYGATTDSLEALESRYGVRPPPSGTSASEIAARELRAPVEHDPPQLDEVTEYDKEAGLVMRALYGREGSREILDHAKRLSRNPQARKLAEFERGMKEAAASVVPGVGVAGGVAKKLLPHVTTVPGRIAAHTIGGAAGGVAGQLASEVESDRPLREIPGRLADAGAGGAVAGGVLASAAEVLGPVAKSAAEWAKRRFDRQTMSDIGNRAHKGTRDKMADAELADPKQPVIGAARKHGIDAVASDPVKMTAKAKTAKKETGEAIGGAWDDIDANVGVLTKDLFSSLSALKQRMQAPSDAPVRKALDRYIADAKALWGDTRRLPLSRLNEEIGKLEKIAFKSSNLDKAQGAQLKQDIAGALEGRMQQRLEEIREFGKAVSETALAGRPAFAEAVAAKEAAEALPGLNRDYKGLSLIERAGKQRQRLTKFDPTGLRQIAGENVKKVADVVSVGTMNPLPSLAARAAPPVWRGAKNAATEATLLLSKAVVERKGIAEAAAAAAAAGVPQRTIDMILGYGEGRR